MPGADFRAVYSAFDGYKTMDDPSHIRLWSLEEIVAHREAGGNYLSPSGTPFEARSLPYDLSRTPLHTFRVLKPFVVQSGRIAPWFDEVGGGVQLRTSQDIDVLVDEEYLHED